MAIFSPRVFPVIFQDMLATMIANSPVNDVNYGSIFSTMLEAAAQEDDEQYFQMLEIIRAFSLDSTTGSDLESRASEFSLTRQAAENATTTVKIFDSSITKVSTGVYSGKPGSPAGATFVNGNSATGFSTTGSIVVGRDTPNVETIAYTSIDDFGNYVRFNLSSALSNDHGTDETIIIAQGGNRTIPAGTVVKVPASDTLEEVSYTLDSAATILDGEREVTGVAVTATVAGTIGNVPIGAIQKFDSKPFSTAEVTNTSRVTNGQDTETDQELRDRIKDTIQSLSRGTGRAITTGVLGLVSASENKRVVSVSLRDTTSPAEVVKLFIDDGSGDGFVPSFEKVGLETVVAESTGGEKFLNVANVPVIKAFVETQNAEPYNIADNTTITVEVNGKPETITFVSTDFDAPGAGTANEVLRKINKDAQTFEARVSNGNNIRIFAKASSSEEIKVTGGTANVALGFPTDKKFTTKLYLLRDNVLKLLSKDGNTASIESSNSATYDFSTRQHLSIVMDGKVANVLKAWFDPSDFPTAASVNALEVRDHINALVPGLVTVESSNQTRVTLESLTERSSSSKVRIVETFTNVQNEEGGSLVDRTSEAQTGGVNLFAADNDYLYLGHADVPFDSVYVRLSTPSSKDLLPVFEYYNGTTFTDIGVDDETLGFTQDGHILFQAPRSWAKTTVSGVNAYWFRIQRTANTVTTPPVASKLLVCAANLVLGFDEAEVVGADKDYTLNRFVGQIELESPLVAGDKLTLGSDLTRAFAVSATPGNYANLVGLTLTVTIDGVLQSYVFQAGDFGDNSSILPSEVVTAINANFKGVLADTVDSGQRVRVRVNRMNGTLQVGAGGANTKFDFPETLIESLATHQPAIESVTENFSFSPGDSIIVVIDGNVEDNLTVDMSKEYSADSSTTTQIVNSTLQDTFPLNADLANFDVEITSGTQVGQRREVSSYVAASGQLNLTTALPGALAAGDKFAVIPKTAAQTVAFMNNTQISLLSKKAEITESDAGTRVQIASLSFGENASVEITGGLANDELQFPVSAFGIDAYKYFTGLMQVVQWTVDGRQDDAETYPGIRAAGVQVEAIEPVTVPVEVSLTIVTNQGVALNSITKNIKSAVTNYVNNLLVSDDVLGADILVAVKGVDGVHDAHITDLVGSNSFGNVPIADNELPSITEDRIHIG